jgi:hypothetical protein
MELDKELLKNVIIKEVKEEFGSQSKIVLDEIIDLLFKILSIPINEDNIDLEGLGTRTANALNKILIESVTLANRETYLADFGKVEQFLKKLLYFIDKEKYKILNDEKKGLGYLISELSLNPQNLSLEKENKAAGNYFEHIARVYRYKNSESHTIKSLSGKEFAQLVQSILIFYIYAIYIHRVKLKQISSAIIIETSPTFHTYCNEVVDQFRERIGRFIHLSSKEDITLSSTYVSEYLLKQEDERDILVREGTVDELRKRKIPEKRMMIWADAGMGKSTTLEYLAYKDAIDKLKNINSNTPVLIPLGLLTDSTVSIKEFIYLKLGVDDKLGEQLLEAGKINLFFDGLNEIPKDPNNNLKTLRIKEIDNLVKFNKRAFIIISNRPQDLNLFQNMPIFFIQKMNDSQIQEFIQKYTNNNNKAVEKVITNRLNTDDRIKNIVRSPLMLSRLIEIVKAEGEIPLNEGMIIDRFINSLYKRETIEKKDANFNEEYIHLLLSNLGHYSLESKGTNSGLTKYEILNEFLKVKKDYGFDIDLIYVLEISCQLNILEKRENLYSFAHQSYQDYFESQYIKILFGE